MVIRKYIAINEEEATKLAKEDLGQDVVILNVKIIPDVVFLEFLRNHPERSQRLEMRRKRKKVYRTLVSFRKQSRRQMPF